jgi:hypothetical protein
LTFARASSSATVYAFEADPREAARLRKGARANDVVDRIEVVEGFVGAGTAGTIALDAVVAGGAPPPDVLKIDVEGAELDVLHGATRVLDDAAPVVFLEVHSAELREACRLVLEGHGYAVRSYEPKASLRGPRPLAGNAWLWAERSRRRP